METNPVTRDDNTLDEDAFFGEPEVEGDVKSKAKSKASAEGEGPKKVERKSTASKK